MEGGGGRRRSSRRETSSISPERGRVSVKQRAVGVIKPSFRKVQVVYYLSRNGLLEHPHYMEVTHLANQQLRLKDVMDRLTVLRGKGMPSLYSWSCKRSYKNGYVWNDLGENDIINPSEGAEYVLKGSELIQGCTEKIQQLQVTTRSQQVPDPTYYQKRKPLSAKRHSEVEADNNSYEEEEEEEEEEAYEDKTSYNNTTTLLTTQYPRCSRGVSTDDTDLTRHKINSSTSTELMNNTTTELSLDNSSPPSTTSSTVSDKANENCGNHNTSKRFDQDVSKLPTKYPVTAESSASRNSVLLQLISCGGSASFRAMKTVPVVRQQPPCTAARKSTGSSLHKGVLCKTAAAAKVGAAAAEEEEMMISCMSENPRFGNLQGEEKEYFSGSIVESIGEERVGVESGGLKRSNSYNEERSSKAELVEAVEDEPKREKVVMMRGKCIPRMKSSSSKHPRK